MAGADFVRADLHVHTHGDNDRNPQPDLAAYVDAALERDIRVLGITDHNTARFAGAAVEAAHGKPLLVLPGIEISTHDGHLLALFSPNNLQALEKLAHPEALKLTDVSETDKRSVRSMLDLVSEIDSLGGLAIPAHIDARDGLQSKLPPAALTELLTSPALAGLEFATEEALQAWFRSDDPDPNRKAAWDARLANNDLRTRGLARLMSSDAHSVDKVGRDRGSRTLTRLRLDDVNFDAVRNAIAQNPRARCKAEVVLPATYPHILSAQFTGGFLDGVEMEFSPNLNCLIGGRGSGKSTALLAIRAALGAHISEVEDPDALERMPDETVVRFVDSTGSERVAVRERGGTPTEQGTSAPIRVRLADLGQDESGQLARGYDDDPKLLLEFLDRFVVRHEYIEQEDDLLAKLAENASEVKRTFVAEKEIKKLQEESARLEASLKAAENGKVEVVAEWARLLAAQGPLLSRLEDDLRSAQAPKDPDALPDLDALASDFGVDLSRPPVSTVIDGAAGLRSQLTAFAARRKEIDAAARTQLGEAAIPASKTLQAWREQLNDMGRRRDQKQKELEAQGLKVQAGAITEMANRLNAIKRKLADLKNAQTAHKVALGTRAKLLAELYSNRDQLYECRRATLRRISDSANKTSDDLTINVYFRKGGLRSEWESWLSTTFGFRKPRVQRLAEQITPDGFAQRLRDDPTALLNLSDDGSPFFAEDRIEGARSWDNIFLLEAMRLEDRPRIDIQEPGRSQSKPFDVLSAGQQRSVLLSLLLCAERHEPLVVDQPEDHLDARYIAGAVVGHLEGAKELRQVLIATHSPNLTVLGDAELVIPMSVEDGHGRPYSPGAVDRPDTRDAVCSLLEGGIDAYRKRGMRYGFRFG
jgi:ABC-type lipoprotein export system ATPase subunit